MKKLLIVLITALLCFPAVTVNVAAATRTVVVYLYQNYTDCVFMVSWENAEQKAAVEVRDPNGATVPQTITYSKGQAYVDVGAAGSGYWTIDVEGNNLGTINVSGGNKNATGAQYNIIRSFDVDFSNGLINFKWNVDAKQNTVNISINAAQSKNSDYYSRRSIWNDYSADRNGSTSVSADELKTGLYFFNIEVYNGNSQYTLSTDEPIYIKQSNSPAKLENVKVGSIDGEMFAVWDIALSSSYLVTLYDYDTLDVIKTERVNTNFYSLSTDEDLDKLKFSVAATDGSTYGEFDVLEVFRSVPSGTVKFPDYSYTRNSSIIVTVDCSDDNSAGVYLDGTLLLEGAAAGSYDLNLSEGEHDILAFIKDKNGNMQTFPKIITVDKTPPSINLTNSDHTATASDSIVIDGNTEPNSVVSINGVEQELGSGSFMAKLALKNGVNPINVAAYDIAGNKSTKTITVEKTGQLGGNWVIYIIPAILFVLLAIWYIFLNKKAKEAPTDEKAD